MCKTDKSIWLKNLYLEEAKSGGSRLDNELYVPPIIEYAVDAIDLFVMYRIN